MKLTKAQKQWFEKWSPANGAHTDVEKGACLLEASAYLAGESFGDHPECVCPVIAAFGRAWNDSLSNERRSMLKPYAVKIIGTKATAATEKKRSYLAIDWYVRTFTATWLELGNHHEEAKQVRGLSPIRSLATLEAALPVLEASSKVASAARSAAWSAAWSAARSAAWSAAWSAARSAADKALEPTVQRLQSSALDLFDRMIAQSGGAA
jgi:hypothetical protein